MNSRFDERIAVITGVASRLGKAIAERIANEGGQVVLFDRFEADCKAAVNDFGRKGWVSRSQLQHRLHLRPQRRPHHLLIHPI